MPLPILQESAPEPKKIAPVVGAGKRAFLHTFGCQMNEHDTQRMAERLLQKGFSLTGDAEDADLVVVNTCSVRELAVQKALSEVGRLKAHKKARGTKIAVTGCVAQQEGDKLLQKYPEIDLVLGPDNIYQLPELVDRMFEGERLVYADLDETAGFQFLTADAGTRAHRISAFVTVQKGCDKHCSYCIVPRVRGTEVSRPLEQIVAEVEGLIAQGVREVTLLGQNIDTYKDPRRFDEVLKQVGSLPGLWRLRFTTSHPNDFSEAMAGAMASIPTICEHLHLPAQSGSDAVLKRMYRGYSKKRYLERIAMVRERMPDIRLTTDLIVGFPGETEEDFQATLDLVEQARFDAAFVFAYSVRPGTPAEPWPDDVSEAEKKSRLHRLNDVMRQMAMARSRRFVGTQQEVLVEGPSRTNPNVLTGRTRHNCVVNFDGFAEPGQLALVTITSEENGYFLRGTLSQGRHERPELSLY